MSSVSSISLTPSKLAWRGFSWITSTSCNVRYIIRFLDHLDCVFQVIASIPTRQLRRLYAKVYWYCEDADRTNRWKHSMTLSRLDMYDTLACHPVGLGNVSSKHFIDRLNALTFTSPRYAKYCYPFTSVLFNNPIPLWNWQTMLSRTNWHHSYRCKTITALFTEKKSAKWCRHSRFINNLTPPFHPLIVLYGQYFGVGSIPWSPLAGGILSRPIGTKTQRSETDR